MDYTEFLASKAKLDVPTGIEVDDACPHLKAFQAAIVRWALRRGRAAIFAGTGLGKTLMQLSWAQSVADYEQGRVLILTPLAVAEQTVAEAVKFEIPGVSYAQHGRSARSDIVVTNYERFDKFNIGDYCGIVLDECFVLGTPVEVIRYGKSCNVPIENIRCGDVILNAAGHDVVRAVARREKNAAVRIVIEGSVYYCSLNHPWFTSVGWRAARDIRAGDQICRTGEAMRLVRETVSSDWVRGSFLREELLSEMANEYARVQGKSSYSGSGSQAWSIALDMVAGDPGGA